MRDLVGAGAALTRHDKPIGQYDSALHVFREVEDEVS